MRGRLGLLLGVMALLPALESRAQSADFYKEKTIKLIIGTDAGGSYDFSGRLVGRHLGRNIPGAPSIIVQNMPGAASLNASNYVYNVAPQDGTVIGAFVQTMPQSQLFGDANVEELPGHVRCEVGEAGAAGHGARDSDDPRVILGEAYQRLAEDVLVIGRGARGRLSAVTGHRIERA